MFKKTAIALAVAGAYGASLPVQAQETESGFYGFVNAAVEYADTTNGGVSTMFLPADADGELYLGDEAQSRFGFTGSTDLGNGMTASARIEFGLTGDEASGDEDTSVDQRLGWVQLAGDFGAVKLGNQWGVLFPYLGYTTYRSYGYGGSSWYEATQYLNDDGFGLRVNDGISYQYGGGGYSSDPFTFTALGVMDRSDGESGAVDETLDAQALGGAVTFGNITVGGAYYGENNAAGDAEPSMWGVSVRAGVTEALWLGGRFTSTDTDTAGADDVEVASVHGEFDFGNGFSTMAGYGTSSNDVDGDLDTIFLQMNKNLGAGTNVYVEFEDSTRDVPGGDQDAQVISVGMIKNF